MMPYLLKGELEIVGRGITLILSIISTTTHGDSDRGISVNLPWTVEVRNAATGRLMATRSSTSRSETISTVGWPKGIYVVKATIGDEELTEKVIVK